MQQRRRFKQDSSLKERLAAFARQMREKADRERPGPERDNLLKRARKADVAQHLDDWANSPGLDSPG